jgi:ribonuclease HI
MEFAAGTTIVYVKGVCVPNPGPGAYAFRIKRNGYEKTICASIERTTCNAAELSAILHALRAIKTTYQPIVVVSNNQIVIRVLATGTTRTKHRTSIASSIHRPIADIDDECRRFAGGHGIEFIWVSKARNCEHMQAVEQKALTQLNLQKSGSK